jgi:hypothetical protein
MRLRLTQAAASYFHRRKPRVDPTEQLDAESPNALVPVIL